MFTFPLCSFQQWNEQRTEIKHDPLLKMTVAVLWRSAAERAPADWLTGRQINGNILHVTVDKGVKLALAEMWSTPVLGKTIPVKSFSETLRLPRWCAAIFPLTTTVLLKPKSLWGPDHSWHQLNQLNSVYRAELDTNVGFLLIIGVLWLKKITRTYQQCLDQWKTLQVHPSPIFLNLLYTKRV